ncbi:MAG: 1-deoxy-D-xylulose-5-phosphate reductoisomerase [Desulfobacteraceae bacterium 4572_35.2]|nr:MAG: 1-deoxy-D-xylulose-5-phosphate reductoisomerase [Desulfobacteraceae bacterium 4572_35.2]
MKALSILGSTGSIGVNTLDVVAEFSERYSIISLSAGSNLSLLAEQIRRFKPQCVSVASAGDVVRLRSLIDDVKVEILSGEQGACQCATHPDVVMVVSAIVGAAGLVPTLAAIGAGKDIALANKETLVMAGSLVMDAVRSNGVKLLPVDSEHCAIHQSLAGHRQADVRKLILTASGGPFRTFSQQQLERVTLAQALAHPNWTMGKKISIDSATMMNKGLEVIEARWLFDIEAQRIDVHVHPQSIVHSMVEYVDGTVIAQMGIPDMKTPIAYALSWPERLPLQLPALDLCALSELTFSRPDLELFPCLKLAYQALEQGGSAPVVLNAANEVAVDSLLKGRIRFLDIPRLIDEVLNGTPYQGVDCVEDVIGIDERARMMSYEQIGNLVK